MFIARSVSCFVLKPYFMRGVRDWPGAAVDVTKTACFPLLDGQIRHENREVQLDFLSIRVRREKRLTITRIVL